MTVTKDELEVLHRVLSEVMTNALVIISRQQLSPNTNPVVESASTDNSSQFDLSTVLHSIKSELQTIQANTKACIAEIHENKKSNPNVYVYSDPNTYSNYPNYSNTFQQPIEETLEFREVLGEEDDPFPSNYPRVDVIRKEDHSIVGRLSKHEQWYARIISTINEHELIEITAYVINLNARDKNLDS